MRCSSPAPLTDDVVNVGLNEFKIQYVLCSLQRFVMTFLFTELITNTYFDSSFIGCRINSVEFITCQRK